MLQGLESVKRKLDFSNLMTEKKTVNEQSCGKTGKQVSLPSTVKLTKSMQRQQQMNLDIVDSMLMPQRSQSMVHRNS